MRPTPDNSHELIDEQVEKFLAEGGKITKVEEGRCEKVNGLTKSERRDTQRMKGRTK